MEQIFCDIHKINIIIYNENERKLFIDDNKQESVIFIDEKGNKKLKRFIIGKCDENCKTIETILG